MYLSEIRHRRVLDAGGDAIGRLRDVAVLPREHLPVVDWAILGAVEGERVVRWRDVAVEPAHVRLRRRLESLAPESLPAGALRLGDLLDRRIGDTRSAGVVRVNDLQLEESGGQLRLVAVDVSARGLLRRIGIEGLAVALVRVVGRSLRRQDVPWSAVDLRDATAGARPSRP
jgi:sporulation protein YlmC with PRC-barrel domain